MKRWIIAFALAALLDPGYLFAEAEKGPDERVAGEKRAQSPTVIRELLRAIQLPVGSILPFYGNENQRPKGWLFCNGGEVSRHDFPDLYRHLIAANPTLRVGNDGVRLPDLRGEFLRGTDLGRGLDSGRKLGSVQPSQAALPQHGHGLSQEIGRSNGWSGGWGGEGSQKAVNGPGDKAMVVQSSDIELSKSHRETRPRNIALNFIIRAVP